MERRQSNHPRRRLVERVCVAAILLLQISVCRSIQIIGSTNVASLRAAPSSLRGDSGQNSSTRRLEPGISFSATLKETRNNKGAQKNNNDNERKATEVPEVEPTQELAEEPEVEPTEELSEEPESEPAEDLAEEPVGEPAKEPEVEAAEDPTEEPVEEFSEEPEVNLTEELAEEETPQTTETSRPTSLHVFVPTKSPQTTDTIKPTKSPTTTETKSPTTTESENPTVLLTDIPTVSPTSEPTLLPTEEHSSSPTVQHSSVPSLAPTETESVPPSVSISPTRKKSFYYHQFTKKPTQQPTFSPTEVIPEAPSLITSTFADYVEVQDDSYFYLSADISVTLKHVPKVMPSSDQGIFTLLFIDFLLEKFFTLSNFVEGFEVLIDGDTELVNGGGRNLRSGRLLNTMNHELRIDLIVVATCNNSGSSEVINFEGLLKNLINNQGGAFVEMLMATNMEYFEDVVEVHAESNVMSLRNQDNLSPRSAPVPKNEQFSRKFLVLGIATGCLSIFLGLLLKFYRTTSSDKHSEPSGLIIGDMGKGSKFRPLADFDAMASKGPSGRQSIPLSVEAAVTLTESRTLDMEDDNMSALSHDVSALSRDSSRVFTRSSSRKVQNAPPKSEATKSDVSISQSSGEFEFGKPVLRGVSSYFQRMTAKRTKQSDTINAPEVHGTEPKLHELELEESIAISEAIISELEAVPAQKNKNKKKKDSFFQKRRGDLSLLTGEASGSSSGSSSEHRQRRAAEKGFVYKGISPKSPSRHNERMEKEETIKAKILRPRYWESDEYKSYSPKTLRSLGKQQVVDEVDLSSIPSNQGEERILEDQVSMSPSEEFAAIQEESDESNTTSSEASSKYDASNYYDTESESEAGTKDAELIFSSKMEGEETRKEEEDESIMEDTEDEEIPLSSIQAFSSFEDSTALSEGMMRDCYAPPGSLGIRIEYDGDHHIITAVSAYSPVSGMVHDNDILVALNDVELSGLAPEEVRKIMTEEAARTKKLTVLSPA